MGRIMSFKFKSKNYCTLCITAFAKCTCHITFFGGYIVYIIIGIAILYGSIDIMKTCPISHLWDFLLVCIIFSVVLQPFTFIFFKYSKSRCLIFIYCIGYITLELLFVIWGSIEIGFIADPDLFYCNDTNFIIIFPNPQTMNITACRELQYTNVWKYSIVSLFIQIIFDVIIVSCMCCKL